MNEYVTLDDFKNYRGPNQTTTDDDLIIPMLGQASRFVNEYCKRRFDVRLETRFYDHPYQQGRLSMAADAGWDMRTNFYGSGMLKMDDDLLEVTNLTTNNGDTTLTAADYFLMCGNKYNLRPYDRIMLNLNRSSAAWNFSGTPQQANGVTGWWGFNEFYPNCWILSHDTVKTAINASATTLAVNDVDGADNQGLTPRFKVLQTLKIENELMHVVGTVAGTTNTMTVIRGINGTTAASHDAGAVIYIYEPMPDIVNATRRLANWLYMQKDSQTDNDRPLLTQTGVTIMPNRLPNDVTMMLAPFVSPFGSGGLW